MSVLNPTRAEVLDLPGYDRHRDGPDMFEVGTQIALKAYTGGTRIAVDDPTLVADRIMFAIRNQPEDTGMPAWMRTVKEDARARTAEALNMYDWDCHKCQTAVMTHLDGVSCPRCGL